MISQRCLSVPSVAIFEIWFAFSEWLHPGEQPGRTRPWTRPKTASSSSTTQSTSCHTLWSCLTMMESNVIQVIQLVVGLKSGVGSPDTKSFDISFRNKTYLSEKGTPVLTMIPY